MTPEEAPIGDGLRPRGGDGGYRHHPLHRRGGVDGPPRVEGQYRGLRILGACDEIVRQQVREYGGREIKSISDGFMVAFGSPRRAVACALAIQDACGAAGLPVRVRGGLHTGEVSEENGDLFGGAVNAVARICAKAQAMARDLRDRAGKGAVHD